MKTIQKNTITTALRLLLSNLDNDMLDTLQENEALTSEEEIQKLIENIDSNIIEFDLADEHSELGISGMLKFDTFGMEISAIGYNGTNSPNDATCIAYLEKYENELKLRVYGDNKSDEPTDNINLEKAKD